MNDYEKRLYRRLCETLTKWEEHRGFDAQEWYDIMVEIQNCIVAQKYKEEAKR